MSAFPTINPINKSTLELPPLAPKEEVSKTETKSSQLDIVWICVNNIAIQWHENQDVPRRNNKEFWEKHATDGHKPLLLPILRSFLYKRKLFRDLFSMGTKDFVFNRNGNGKLAIDLGCGNSPATKHLLRKGWRVISVDNCRGALNVIAEKYPKAIESGQLQIAETDIAEFSLPEPADLVIAADCFPYTDPAKFQATWNAIHDLLVKKDGFFIGSFFIMNGTHDPDQAAMIHRAIEFGSWFLPSPSIVTSLLQETGYQIEKCKFRNDSWFGLAEPVCLQFVAKKI